MSLRHGRPIDPSRRRRVNLAFVGVCLGACSVSVMVLGVLLMAILMQGWERVTRVNVGAFRGEVVPAEIGDGLVVDVPVDGLEPMGERLEVVAGTGKRVTFRLEDLEVLEGERYRGWHFLLDGPIEFGEEEIVSRETVYAYEHPEHGRLEVRGEALEDRPFREKLGRYTGLGDFLTSIPSRFAPRAGIYSAVFGTIYVSIICALTALPLGVGTAVFLEEFRPRGSVVRRLHSFVELNIRNLAGVPSIVYGILGLTAFAQFFGLGSAADPLLAIGSETDWYYFRLPFGRSVLAGGLTLMLVVLPIVIIASQEALRSVPGSLREGTLAMGATRWQMVRGMTLPAAIPGIMTGSILAMSRAVGEAAPILIIAGVIFMTTAPRNLMDEFTVMPLQIFDWARRAQPEFQQTAAAGIIVLLAVLLTMNLGAVLIRQKFQKPLQ